MARPATFFALLGAGVILLGRAAPAQETPEAEIRAYLDGVQAKMRDPARPLEERQRLALEAAATLDRAAQGLRAAETQRQYWADAAALLDRFQASQPNPARARELAFQAAVYRWARAWRAKDLADSQPSRQDLHQRARDELDAVIAAFRPLLPDHAPAGDAFDANVRYRLAHALEDRAELAAAADPAGRTQREEALALLPPSTPDAALRARMDLLRADLQNRLDQADAALKSLAHAREADPGLPVVEVLGVHGEALARVGRGEEALREIDAADLDADQKTALAVRVWLVRWERLPAGAERSAAASALFRRAGTDIDHVPRRVLQELARRMPAPDASQEPIAWEDLAEGRLDLGDAAGAATLLEAGAARADQLGRHAQAVALHYRAAAALVTAGAFARAAPSSRRCAPTPAPAPIDRAPDCSWP